MSQLADQAGPALLLVDDIAENLVALEAALAPLGHQMIMARSGEEALAHLLRREFAAIVLDVQMPGLDGFQTAAAIRQRERNRHIPIIFLTAINRDEVHRLRGYEVGAVDYIFKPIDPEVLRAKVGVFVQLHLQERQLIAQREQLERRTAELARSNADLEQFAYVASHDLQEPLRVITGHLELLEDRLGDVLDDDCRRWIGRIDAAAVRMADLLDGLLSYGRVNEQPSLETVLLGDALADALANLQTTIEVGAAEITSDPLPEASGPRREVARIFQNLVANAVHHAGDQPARVHISGSRQDGLVTVTVADDGPGVPPDQMDRLFGMFERLGDQPSPGVGLGLAICRRIVARLGGRIWMEPNQPSGVKVCFTLPEGPS
ncbi:MAG TPA: ATP-binding protein [Acidimicrobiales bacterium]|nr:ATP-binding protein [Acidimicrobiales bacterium]